VSFPDMTLSTRIVHLYTTSMQILPSGQACSTSGKCSWDLALPKNAIVSLEKASEGKVRIIINIAIRIVLKSNNQDKGPPQRMIHLNVEVSRRSLLIA